MVVPVNTTIPNGLEQIPINVKQIIKKTQCTMGPLTNWIPLQSSA